MNPRYSGARRGEERWGSNDVMKIRIIPFEENAYLNPFLGNIKIVL